MTVITMLIWSSFEHITMFSTLKLLNLFLASVSPFLRYRRCQSPSAKYLLYMSRATTKCVLNTPHQYAPVRSVYGAFRCTGRTVTWQPQFCLLVLVIPQGFTTSNPTVSSTSSAPHSDLKQEPEKANPKNELVNVKDM